MNQSILQSDLEPDQIRNRIFLPYQELPKSHHLASIQFKISYVAFWVMTYFPLWSPFPTNMTSEVFCYSHGKCSDKSNSLVSAFQTFTAQIHLATCTELKHSYSLCIPFQKLLSKNCYLFGTDSCMDAFQNATILTFSNLESIFINLLYYHNCLFLFSLLIMHFIH